MVAIANNSWKPIEHNYIKNQELRRQIHEQGFSILNLIPEAAIQSLLDLFYDYHNLENEKGGVFFSIFSQNTDYRKAIHDKILNILQPIIDPVFQNYKIVLNSFVIKVSGPESEFYVHQDTTSLDESKYSALTLWIPLQDVNTENGCLGLVPYSKHFFSPYRSISFPAPYEGIRETIKNYLKPIEMSKGDMLLFDNRTLHHSYRNLSGKPRISVICGLFPKEAQMLSYTKPKYEYGGKFEVIEHDDTYLLTGKNFLKDNDKRPETGKSLGWFDDPYQPMDSDTFEELCRKYGVEKNALNPNSNPSNCNIIGEPK
jgi:hypothetical protein